MCVGRLLRGGTAMWPHMNARESVEMLMDARRSRIRVTHRHLMDMQQYLVLRDVPYSPEYLLTWGLFPKSRGARARLLGLRARALR